MKIVDNNMTERKKEPQILKLKINLKQIGQRKQKIAPVGFEYCPIPQNLQELIVQTVTSCVNSYNERVRQGDSAIKPLSKGQIEDMADIGKVAFGINYGGKEQKVEEAIVNALQSFKDGLYRVFLNDKELEKLEEKLDLKEDDSLTFIRLTMLAGRIW